MAAIRGSVIAVALCLTSSAAWAAAPAGAASWRLASPKGEARATFTPGEGAATVVVERRTNQGWRLAWRGALRPGSGAGNAFLADDGRMLNFCDDAVDGGDAIVLHDAQGAVVRELDLGQFLPAAYLQSLPRDARGLHWRRGAKLAGAQDSVEFSVALPGSSAGASGPSLRFSVDLRDGSVRTTQIREYLAAADRARTLVAAKSVPVPRVSSDLAVAGTSLPTAAIAR